MAKKLHLSNSMILIIGFFCVLLIGSLLLMLPIAHQPGVSVSPIDAAFTATSAVCVTGLTTVNLAQTFSNFGYVVIALLMQVGGLGFMSVAVVFFVLLGKRIGLRERIVLKESLGQNSISGIVRLVKAIVIMTLTIETAGAIVCFTVFVQRFPVPTAIKISLFHAVSAFNNAGLDILGDNLLGYVNEPVIVIATAMLIILGGLGFAVIYDICRKRSFRKLTMHSKIVICVTVFLLIAGTLLFKLTDNMTWLSAFFQSTTSRTAGFQTVDNGLLSSAGLMVTMVLMFIGASPGSTGGGIKTTTFFAMILAMLSLAKGRDRTAFRRKIPMENILKAFIITLLGILICVSCTLLVSMGEPGVNLSKIAFESVSAFGTVGLSTGITPALHSSSKLVLILTMFFGRVGPLTIACAWSFRSVSKLNYVEENITVG